MPVVVYYHQRKGVKPQGTGEREREMTKWKNFSTGSTATVEADFTGFTEVHIKDFGCNRFRNFDDYRQANEWLRKSGFKCWNRFSKKYQ